MPQDGDVIIRRRVGAAVVFVLGRHGGPGQLLCDSLSRALAVAHAIALQDGTAVWYTEDEVTFRLMPSCDD